MNFLCSLAILLGSLQHPAAEESADSVDLVASLYREYAWEAVVEEPRLDGQFFFTDRSSLERYLTQELVDLVLQDRAHSELTGEPGGLNFSPLWESQDPKATMLKVQPFNSPSEVVVSFHYPGLDDQIKIIYQVEPTQTGWRISDIQYSSGDTLRQSLAID